MTARKKKKPEPRPILYAHIDVFIPMNQTGDFFQYANTRGWQTHTEMPLVLENDVYRTAYVGPADETKGGDSK